MLERIMASRHAEYELSELLNEVFDRGYGVFYISKLWRLLGKGSRAAGTWKALLDAWEESREGNKRNGLYICEMPGEYILLSKVATDKAVVWAGEA
jgi:hypothetical protein